jgi:hypothetical protein
MRNCQIALIDHLRAHFSAPTIRTVKEYAGELADANELGELLPAVLVMFIDGFPAAQEKQYEFDLIIVVQNDTLEKLAASKSNLQLAAEVIDYLRGDYLIRSITPPGSYEIDRETLRARTIINDARFNIIAISIFIKDWH